MKRFAQFKTTLQTTTFSLFSLSLSVNECYWIWYFFTCKNSYRIPIYQCNFCLWFSLKHTRLMLLWVLFRQGLQNTIENEKKKKSLENKWLLFKSKSIEIDNYCIIWDMECHDYFEYTHTNCSDLHIEGDFERFFT